MSINIQIPDEGLITYVTVDGRDVHLERPVEVKKSSRVIDFTDISQQIDEYLERPADRDFIEST